MIMTNLESSCKMARSLRSRLVDEFGPSAAINKFDTLNVVKDSDQYLNFEVYIDVRGMQLRGSGRTENEIIASLRENMMSEYGENAERIAHVSSKAVKETCGI